MSVFDRIGLPQLPVFVFCELWLLKSPFLLRQLMLQPTMTLSEGRHRRYPLTWSPPFDTSKESLRADVEVCGPAQQTDGAPGVQITRGNVLIGDQMAFLVGTGGTSDF
jgi:hypothetical protein